MSVSTEDFVTVNRSYLLVTNIPYFINAAGQVLFDHAWHRDLIQHFHYLVRFTLAAPLCPLPADPSRLVPLDEGLRARMRLVPLPAQASRVQALGRLPGTFRALWQAVGQAEIVHTGIAGWPYPFGWLANPIARLRGKKLLIIVESAPWRLSSGAGATPLRKRVEAAVYERLARWWCTRADLSFYTQPAYLEQLHSRGRGPAYVAPATWVNGEDILDDIQACALWDAKMSEPVRFLFAGRLVVEKGVKILLEAVEKLAAAGVRGEVHIIGEGPLREAVLAARRAAPLVLAYLEPVTYGKPFLTLLQRYHAVVVPSLSDEQPRIVFDAAARAAPVLASDTDGLRPYVENDRTGCLIRPGDSSALADAMAAWATNPDLLRRYALEALSRVRRKTHRAMHAERSRILARHWGAG
jgi:glycosyltransferase involved in cell wall biosynthesis